MRVTGGEHTGRRIAVPRGEIRPAMDRMRESLFGALEAALGSFSGLNVLDLFSGSGSMALEALSRGARYAVLVEADRGKAEVIRKNLSYIDPERWKLVIAKAERYVRRAAGGGAAAGAGVESGGKTSMPQPPLFDLIFTDPPFRYAAKRRLLEGIAGAHLLSAGGRLLIHFPREDDPGSDPAGLQLVDERAYGRSIVRMYEPV